jgi:hypothetical protein
VGGCSKPAASAPNPPLLPANLGLFFLFPNGVNSNGQKHTPWQSVPDSTSLLAQVPPTIGMELAVPEFYPVPPVANVLFGHKIELFEL